MRLVYDKTKTDVKIGDVVTIRDETPITIIGIHKPHKTASTGRVTVKYSDFEYIAEYYPSVIGATWIEREDH